jgi:hypothetical protein
MQASLWDRILAASAYFFGIPALYIVLTENRNKGYLGYHGAQAFFLWGMMLIVFFALRFYIDWMWSRRFIPQLEKLEMLAVAVMGAYVLYCGGRCLFGRVFRIPG